jgi:hypothetical protein
MFYNEDILEILNGLIQFTLFITWKFNSKVEQIESRTVSWNGLCSTFEGSLYLICAWRHVSAAHAAIYRPAHKQNKYLDVRTIWDPICLHVFI